MTPFLWNALLCLFMMYEKKMWLWQKLDMILANKLFQKLKLPKILCNKDCSPKLMLLHKQIRQFHMLFDKENWLLESDFCTFVTKPHYVDLQQHTLKPGISTNSKPRRRPRTRLLKCFVLQHNVIKTKHLRSLIRVVVRGFEWVEILGLTNFPWALFWFLAKSITNFGYPWSEQKKIWFQIFFAIYGFSLLTQQLLYYGYWLVKRTRCTCHSSDLWLAADTYQAWYLVPETLK